MKTLLTPESTGSGSCVQHDEETGRLFVQSFDSYGYQRELIMSRVDSGQDAGWQLHAYQHPGRHEIRQMTAKEGGNLIASLLFGFRNYPAMWFNPHTADRGRNAGFVRFQEAIFNGVHNLSDYL